MDTAPSLNELSDATTAAWLWDAARLRIVWANAAGVGFFGCESLFDLIDMPFDEADPGVGRVAELATSVQSGESWQEIVSFASAVTDAPFSVTLHVHELADGRDGLLMIADSPLSPAGFETDKSAHAGSVLEALPVATVICDENAAIGYANAMARNLFGETMMPSVLEFGEKDVSAKVFDRARRAGIASSIITMATGFGSREIKVTAKPLTLPDEAAEKFTLVLEDVTERRALERGLPTTGIAASANPAAAAQTPPAGNLANLRHAIEATSSRSPASSPASGAQPDARPVQPSVKASAREPAKSTVAPAIGTTAMPDGFGVAKIVRTALSAIPKAIILYRGGKVVYANQASARALGYASENDLVERHDIASVLGGLAGKNGSAVLERCDGSTATFTVEKSTFPWNDGAIPMAVLIETAGKGSEEEPQVRRPESTSAEREVKSSQIKQSDENSLPSSTRSAAIENTFELAAKGASASRPTQSETQAAAKPAVSAAEIMSILDTATDGIVFLADDGSITHMSAGAEALFGVHAASVIDKPLAELMDKASAKIVRDYLAALGDSGLSMLFNGGREIVANVNEGGDVPIFITMRKTSAQMPGIPASTYCAVMRDITQWKKTEAELRHARDTAEHTSRQKSEFLARISHELRTPLNAILGFSDIMRNGQFGKLGSERYEGYANDIHTSGEYLLSLVNDLLDLSKVEAGKLELNFISVDLTQAIDSCMKLMQDEATGARVVLRKSIAPDLPQVVADMRSIKQVLLNLTSNAIKFTDPGGQVIISAKAVATGELLLSVSDTGIGMDEEQLSTALEPFRRVEVAGRPDVQGTGLGLPLTKALVEANRAKFAISSEARKGTRVDVTFPTTRVLAS